ncbi:hypothetical protein BDV12DRAFT_179749 [Aspergillus spectabilis]
MSFEQLNSQQYLQCAMRLDRYIRCLMLATIILFLSLAFTRLSPEQKTGRLLQHS